MANNKQEFDAVCGEAGSGLVAVQISTRTCGPCKVVYPHFAGLSEELPEVTFVKIMGDHDTESRVRQKRAHRLSSDITSPIKYDTHERTTSGRL